MLHGWLVWIVDKNMPLMAVEDKEHRGFTKFDMSLESAATSPPADMDDSLNTEEAKEIVAENYSNSKPKLLFDGEGTLHVNRLGSDDCLRLPVASEKAVSTLDARDEVSTRQSDEDCGLSLRGSDEEPQGALRSSKSRFRGSLRESLTASISSAKNWLLFHDDVEEFGPRRRLSSMVHWASLYRFSINRARVTETSHFVAQSKWGRMLENIFMPYTPESIESFTIFLVIFSLVQTLPMGWDRLRFGKWVGSWAPLEFCNWVLKMMGFNPFFEEIVYIEYGTDEENPTRPGIDLAFGLHITCGLLWVIFGGLQIICYQTCTRKFHRRFGYVTTAVLLAHAGAALHNLWRDIVHHHPTTKALLFHDLAASVTYIIAAIFAAKRGEMETHQDMMIRGYLYAIEGSGTIRFTALVLHLIGKQFKNVEIYIHTGACQNQYKTASAYDCVGPYILRLQLMRLLTLYFNAMYLRTTPKLRDITSRKDLSEEFYGQSKLLVQSILCVYILFQLQEFEWVRVLFGSGGYTQIFVVGVYTAVMIVQRSKHIRTTLLMPRRNALTESTVLHAAAVAEWDSFSSEYEEIDLSHLSHLKFD